jgi:membrane protease YdiL (CAAX protease family)
MEKEKLSWFKIMWRNFYIQIFVIALTGIIICIVQRDNYYDPFGFWAMIGIFSGMLLSVSILGFWKFWKYLKKLEKDGKL